MLFRSRPFNFAIHKKSPRRFYQDNLNNQNESQIHFYSLEEEDIGNLLKPILPTADKELKTKFRYGISLVSHLKRYPRLIPESIVGWTNSSEPQLVHLDFREQSAFVKFLHESIATYVDRYESCPYLCTKAKLFKSGWMYIEDERAVSPLGRTPDPDDILGYCLVRNGKIVPKSYQAMPTHRLFSHLGEFRIPKPIHHFVLSNLVEKLEQANSKN